MTLPSSTLPPALSPGPRWVVHPPLLAAVADRPEPVIVIFSDHGYDDEADTQARFANFLAASTPGAPGLLAGSPTPVNLFPLLLNRYLGTDFALSEDRYFVPPRHAAAPGAHRGGQSRRERADPMRPPACTERLP